MEKVRWGIVSTGRIAHQFVQDTPLVQQAEVVAVSSRAQASADAFAARYGIPRAYAGLDRMLEDPDVDAVYVATPHTLHYSDTMEAVRARKHVLCEKPFTVTPDEARRVFHVAEQSSVFVMEAMWTYFLPAIRKALDWARQGRIGALRQVKADFGYPFLPFDPDSREYNAGLAGGSLLDMGIYPVALAWLFTQREPESIQVACHKAPNGVDDEVAVIYDYGTESEGLRAVLGSSFRSKLQNWAYIIGEEGYIAIPDFWRASRCHLYHLDERIDDFEDGRQSLGFNYETEAACRDILAGRQQNETMPWVNTLRFQDHLARIMDRF
jgi:predicted dehydrogenase